MGTHKTQYENYTKSQSRHRKREQFYTERMNTLETISTFIDDTNSGAYLI